jgi:hypothetical protein
VISAVECDAHEAVADHGQHYGGVLQMEATSARTPSQVSSGVSTRSTIDTAQAWWTSFLLANASKLVPHDASLGQARLRHLLEPGRQLACQSDRDCLGLRPV